ncbi:MAG TPA: hypothetical protein VMM93_00630 [Vicinamibacterales bacterium]|nr:hypothetical protein [Vicinamibacterales bacterium]
MRPAGVTDRIMTDVRIGQLIAASLYDAIQEELPQRLDFYETWLGAGTMPDRRGNLAAMTAVLGFLRTEGEAYDRVMVRAGHTAAAWMVEGLAPVRRRIIARLREVPRTPLCAFYLAATIEILSRFGVTAVGRLAGCRAIEGLRCVIELDWSGHRVSTTPAVAA